MTHKPKILLVEPSKIICEGFSKILADSTLFAPLSQLSSIDYLEKSISSTQANVVIINPILIESNKIDTLRQLVQKYPSCVFVAFQTSLTYPELLSNFQKVIDIYTNPAQVIKILQEFANTSYSNSIQTENSSLSKREIEVLVLVSKGFMNKEIAKTLNISLNTVLSHRKNITQKTGIKSVAGLTVYAVLHNYINFNK